MRWITLLLAALLVLIQYPLWFGHGGWLRVAQMQRQVEAARQENETLKARNDKLAAEVKDLREGGPAIEERARYELGMVKDGELFVQIVDPSRSSPPGAAAPGSAPVAAVVPGTGAAVAPVPAARSAVAPNAGSAPPLHPNPPAPH